MAQEKILPFDVLPDDARVSSRALCQMIGKSRATLWRMVQAGHLPAPTRLTPKSRPDWRLRDIRKALSTAE